MQPLLSIEHLTKAYPGVVANDSVSLEIQTGQIHALLGENGAGKSTLVKAIYGLIKPDSGTMHWQGQAYAPNEPRAARLDGVAMVFQHFSLFEALTVAENISLGMEKPPEHSALSEQITTVSQNYGLPLDPHRLVGDLSAGERQRVEIIRWLVQNPKLLIMDEPTSVLTPQEVDILFATLRQLSSEGTAILYISHKLEEIRSLCDYATVLRLGKVVGKCIPAEKTARDLAEMMVGATLDQPKKSSKLQRGEVVLKAQNLCLPRQTPFGVKLESVHFQLRSGEILGIAGVAGNGQDELLLALSGEEPLSRESLWFLGQPMGNKTPDERRRLGVLTCPEERLGHAAAPEMSLVENAYLSGRVRKNLAKSGFIRHAAVKKFAKEIVQKFDVRTPRVENSAQSLSGGNLQKFVIGREIMQNPKVLVVNQPTWGVDAAAAAAIRQALMDLAASGAGVIVVSQDLDELLEIADQFAALNDGQLSPVRDASGLSVDEIGLMMGGSSVKSGKADDTKTPQKDLVNA